MGSSFPSFYYFFCFVPSLLYRVVLFFLCGEFVSCLSKGHGVFSSQDVVVTGALFIVMFVISVLHTILIYFVCRIIANKYNLY